MYRAIVHSIVFLALATGLSACGLRGKLQSPSQIKYHAEKQARRDGKTDDNQKELVEPAALDKPINSIEYNEILDAQPYPVTPSNHLRY